LAPNNTYEEQDLLKQVSEGNEQAFTRLVDHYSRKVFVHLLTFTKSYESAEELAQDIFLKIWNHRAELSKIKSFSDYLFIVSRNHLISFLRKKLPVIVEPGIDLIAGQTMQPGEQVELKELQQRIENSIQHLRPQQQKVFRMSREQGLTYQQIAEQLAISPETVKWHLAEALNQLRIYFREHGDLLILSWIAFNSMR
jgi:RNA polymerase sigma-70 factor (family 1)